MGIVGKMMGGMEVTELDEMSKSAIAELGNMITGNALARFEKENLHLDISPPTVMTGKGITIGWPMRRGLLVPLHTEVGDLVVWVCMEETKSSE